MRFKGDYWQKLLQEKPDRHIELLLTLAITFFAAVQLIVSCNNNASTTQQTDQLISAAKVSAYAAQQNLEASRNFADSARHVNEGVSDAVKELNGQARATESARDSATVASNKALQASVEFAQRQQRAWVGVESATPTLLKRNDAKQSLELSVTFSLRNFGRSAADHVRISAVLIPEDLNQLSQDVCTTRLDNLPGDVLIPGQAHELSQDVLVSIQELRLVTSRPQRNLGNGVVIQLQGCVRYSDSFDPSFSFSTPFAYFLTGKNGLITPDAQTAQGDQLFLIQSPTGVGYAR